MTETTTDYYRIRFDPCAAMLQVTLNATMTDDVFERYLIDLAAGVAAARGAGPAIRAMFDTSAIESLSPRTGKRIAALADLFVAADRIAVIVRSSLVKLEMRRVAHSPDVQSFISAHAALTWLNAFVSPQASAA